VAAGAPRRLYFPRRGGLSESEREADREKERDRERGRERGESRLCSVRY
jgi:hypothetical protein